MHSINFHLSFIIFVNVFGRSSFEREREREREREIIFSNLVSEKRGDEKLSELIS